jgi:hypothetical protein
MCCEFIRWIQHAVNRFLKKIRVSERLADLVTPDGTAVSQN